MINLGLQDFCIIIFGWARIPDTRPLSRRSFPRSPRALSASWAYLPCGAPRILSCGRYPACCLCSSSPLLTSPRTLTRHTLLWHKGPEACLSTMLGRRCGPCAMLRLLLPLVLWCALGRGELKEHISTEAEYNTECKTCPRSLCPNELYYETADAFNVTCWTRGTRIMGDR